MCFFEGVVYSSIKRYTEFCQSLETDLILSLMIELSIPNLINMAVVVKKGLISLEVVSSVDTQA